MDGQVEDADTSDTFIVSGRGALHITILVETMRREGYEFCVGPPQVIMKEARAPPPPARPPLPARLPR